MSCTPSSFVTWEKPPPHTLTTGLSEEPPSGLPHSTCHSMSERHFFHQEMQGKAIRSCPPVPNASASRCPCACQRVIQWRSAPAPSCRLLPSGPATPGPCLPCPVLALLLRHALRPSPRCPGDTLLRPLTFEAFRPRRCRTPVHSPENRSQRISAPWFIFLSTNLQIRSLPLRGLGC